MKKDLSEDYISKLVNSSDKSNLEIITQAEKQGKINAEAREYLKEMYSESMHWFLEVFHILGKCFGAPKAAVMQYDYESGVAIDQPMKIADINPLSAYMVYHRLDADPMRNQFFSINKGHKVDLYVSSIVSVIVGAQKNIERSLEKITGKYYNDYVEEVVKTAENIISSNSREASGRAIAEKIRTKFSEKFITNSSETVLGIIGCGNEKISVDLVRELDKIEKPHLRLKDVWRVKCLFDLISQARVFMERIYELAPDKIIAVKDKFYDIKNPRNYRDAKIILNIGTKDNVIPLEVICQVRTLFEFDRKNHEEYKIARKGKSAKKENIEKNMAEVMENGIREYNLMIYHCLEDIFERVGWNILYNRDRGASLFDGFPRFSKQYYSQKIIDVILEKLDNAVENEVFHVEDAPRKLSQAEELEIFRWMTKFILISAMPYMNGNSEMPNENVSGRLFNFVMKELQRYDKK
ncbi:MAG: hypothetical protein JW974_03310 [Alphaproteobacteria bacterium]|nr:hypothetical protein [Alphaproteobacteria bacterium]MBN2674877.1 hypothetical protein [Alphaproteobacteria bacterium]